MATATVCINVFAHSLTLLTIVSSFLSLACASSTRELRGTCLTENDCPSRDLSEAQGLGGWRVLTRRAAVFESVPPARIAQLDFCGGGCDSSWAQI